MSYRQLRKVIRLAVRLAADICWNCSAGRHDSCTDKTPGGSCCCQR